MLDERSPNAPVPIGGIVLYAGTYESMLALNEAGWCECDGRELQIADFVELFDVLGSSFGGNNSTYFVLPDLRGKFARGVDHGAGHDPDAGDRESQTAKPNVGNTGDNVGSVQGSALAVHQHNWNGNLANIRSDGDNIAIQLAYPGGNKGSIPTTETDGGTASETRPANVYLYYLIYCGAPVLAPRTTL